MSMHGVFQCGFPILLRSHILFVGFILLKVRSVELLLMVPGLEMQLPILNYQAMLTKLGDESSFCVVKI